MLEAFSVDIPSKNSASQRVVSQQAAVPQLRAPPLAPTALTPPRLACGPAKELARVLFSTSDTNRTHLSAMSRPSSPAGLSAPGHEGTDSPHPHHLAEHLPPINFEPASSEHTVADSAGEPTGAASEKGGATLDGGIEADAAAAAAGDAEKGVASGPAVSDYPDGGFRAWR